MYVQARSVAATAVLTGLLSVISGCASMDAPAPDDECSIGQVCKLRGELTILRGVPASVGILETTGGCVPLALSQDVYRSYQHWNHERVLVTGRSSAQGDVQGLTWYAVEDRQVSAGACKSSALVIYVTDLRKE
jgi:hypothetical protein